MGNSQQTESELFAASEKGSFEEVQRLLDLNVNPNAVNEVKFSHSFTFTVSY